MSDTPDEMSERRRYRTAQAQAEQDHVDRLRRLLLGAAVVVVIGAIVAGVIIFQGQAASTTPVPHVPRTAAGQSSLVMGEQSAPIHVVVYEDFQCPYCREFEMGSRDFLHADAAAGKVYVEYHPIASINDYSTHALNAFATVLDTAGPKVALKFHDLLYDRQPAETGPALTAAQLVSLAVKAGAKRKAVQGPIGSLQHKQWVAQANAAASKAGVRGTPTVLVNGKPLAGSSIDQMVNGLETTIARKG